MNTDTNTSRHKDSLRASMTWGKRVVFVLLVLVGAGYAVLSLAERSPEPIRLGLQDYLSEVSGHTAQITDIGAVGLVPDVSLDLKKIVIIDKGGKKSFFKAERVFIEMPILSMILGQAKYRAFAVENAEIATGFFLPEKLALKFAGISSDDAALGEAIFMAEGQYNNLPLLFTADMMMDSRKKKPVFYFHDQFPISLKLGKTELSGRYVRSWSGLEINDIEARRTGDGMTLNISNIANNPFSAAFTGEYNGQSFLGTIIQNNGLMDLSIRTQSPEKLNEFLTPILKDFGLYGQDELLKLDIRQE